MMKRALVLSLLSVFAASVASAELPKAPTTLPRLPVAPLPTVKIPVKPPVLQCADPAATAVDFAIVTRASRFAGRVRVTGKVKNLGRAAYESRPNQQTIQLYETVPGGRPRLVAQRPFVNVAPDEELSVTFVRDWNASSPAEGEFPPSYKVVIAYDPDIALDGNPKNDDCNTRNNAEERSGTAINALFR